MMSEEQDYHENEDRPMNNVWRSDAHIFKVLLKEFRQEDGSQPPDLESLERGTTTLWSGCNILH